MTYQGGNTPQAQAARSGHSLLHNPRVQNVMQAAPQRATLALLLTGMVIGLLVAYVIIPTEFTGASPRHMSQQAVEQWVRMVAVGHSQSISYDDANALLVLQQIPQPQATVRSLAANVSIPLAERNALAALTNIRGFNDLTGAAAPQDPGAVVSSLQVLASLVIVALGAIILTIIGRSALASTGGAAGAGESADGYDSMNAPAQGNAPQAYAESAGSGADWTDSATRPSGTMHPEFGAPVLHAVSSWNKGGNYDESFAIELSHEHGSEFLGECGLSAASQVDGELQSVEFWGFDIQTQETRSKFFAAPAAMGDQNLLASLSERIADIANDMVAAEPGAVQVVESSALIIQAEVKAVVCNFGGGMPNSGIESLQIEVMAWYKGVTQAAVPAEDYPGAVGSPFGEYAKVSVGPPPQSGSPPPPPAVGDAPARKRPEDEEEDPFGGTGNFMPFS